MIGTHNSATGEKSSFFSLFVVPFARCQTKTLVEQYKAGCRYFDIRLKFDKKNNLIFAHGLWHSKAKALKTLQLLNNEASKTGDKCYVSVMYEGVCPDNMIDTFCSLVYNMFSHILCSLTLTHIDVKYPPYWIKKYNEVPFTKDFVVLNGTSWHTYLPIPWLWNKIYTSKHCVDNSSYKLIDFL